MRPPLLPPLPILLACAIWFLHGFSVLAYRSYVLWNQGGALPVVEIVIALIFIPLMIGSLLIVSGLSDWSAFLMFEAMAFCMFEFLTLLIGMLVGMVWPVVVLLAVSLLLLFASLVLSREYHAHYDYWRSGWQRFQLEAEE